MSNIMETKKYFLKMIATIMCGQSVPVCPENIDLAQLCRLASKNAVNEFLYLAIKNGSVTVSETVENNLRNSYISSLMRDTTQAEERAFIRKNFAEKEIDFMFLKGSHLKELYPAPEVRFMVDMDVLVHEKDLKKGQEIILSQNFEQVMNNGKDIVFVKKPFLTIELHKMLFVEDYFMHDYFIDTWKRAEQVSEHEYKMSTNDLYVYVLAHLAEHYLEAGSCFRPVMDLFLMERVYGTKLDFDYINKQFKIIGIEKFASKIRELYKCMFDDGEYNEDLSIMENYIVLGPPVKNADEVSRFALSKKSKSKRLIETAFPSLRHMRLRYPILEKLPFLLPIYWIVRIFQYIVTKDEKHKIKHSKITNVDEKSAEIMREIFEKSGF